MHGLVAISVPPYFEQPSRSTQHTRHPLALRQVHTTANYYIQQLYIGLQGSH